MNKLGKNDTPY